MGVTIALQRFVSNFILKRALNFPLILWNETNRRHEIPLRIYLCLTTAGAVVGSHDLFHIQYWARVEISVVDVVF